MVPITDEERTLPYAKYYFEPLAPIAPEKLNIWHGPMADPQLATPFALRDRFLDDGTEPLEMGFTVAPDGTGFVSASVFIPEGTTEMFYWWFAWHCVGPDLRYKLWDHDDHYYARAMDPDYVLNPNVPMPEKTWGVTHDILEDIGLGAEPLKLDFLKPSDLGYSMEKIGTKGCAGMVCAVGASGSPAVMTHKVVEMEGGILLKSHFWMGYGYNERHEIVKLVPDGASVPEAFPRALFGHCIKEFSNLASVLPRIYAEEHAR